MLLLLLLFLLVLALLLRLLSLYWLLLFLFVLLIGLFHLINKFFLLNSRQGIFNVLNCPLRRLVVLRSSLSIDLKSINFRFIEVDFGWQNDSFRVVFQEHMREASTEISTINIDVSKFRHVNFFTPWTEYLKSRSL